jgi:phospholipid/cholesterol/gamma-HCH transport system ATP-binding protein
MVSLRSLHKSFDGTPVLRDINLDVARGEVVAIMGSSGGGKTTLLRCISGLISPTSGEILVDNIDVQKDPEEARRRMGMVFQSAALFDYMNVHDNVLFGIRRQLRLNSRDQKQTAKDALERVGLVGDEFKMPAELSGGMRKRVGIARAIALKPNVMLYDEPTTGLDPITAYTIDRLIVDLRSDLQVTTLVVSHDVSSVYRVADRIAFLHEGELIFVGTTEEFSNSREASIKELVSKSQATTFSA